ncbi:MAG: tetratricopeptide repeat protein [Terracidiphilus sp.]
MFNSRYFFRTLKYAAASLSILAIASIAAKGQTPADIVPHSTPSQVEEGVELNKGAAAYRGARYDEAISHFQKATELAPDEPIAKMYLAVALSQNVVSGLETPENLKIAQKAIDLFQQVLEKRPHDLPTMQLLAGVEFEIKRLNDAKEWQKKVLAEDPKDPEAAYTIGVIDWQEAHQNALRALDAAGLNDDGMGNAKAPAALMEKIKALNSALVEEGLAYLNRAVENRPNYEDSMAYLNLMYRRKADVDWGNESARKEDVATAEQWRNKAMETRRANEEKKNAESASPQR